MKQVPGAPFYQDLLGRPQCFLPLHLQPVCVVTVSNHEAQQQQRQPCSFSIAQQQELEQQM